MASRRASTRAFAAIVAAGLCGAILAPRDVVAGDVDCPTASEQGQKLRDQGKLRSAREMFLLCSKPSCPSVVRKDCAKWLPEIEDAIPTVVFSVQDASGNDLSAVNVTIDGASVATTLDGKAIPVDLGPHVIVYEAQGVPTLTQNVIIHTGEKNRIVKATFAATTTTTPKPPVDSKPTTPTTPTTERHKAGVPVLTYVLGGVGVLGLGSFAFFGITGKSDLSNLRNTCAPTCDQSALDSAKTKLLVADISLGVGALALGGAAVIFLTRGDDDKAPKTGLSVTPLPGGGAASLSGSF